MPANQPLLRTGNALTRAEAAFALGDLRSANDLFRAAVAENPAAPLPRVRWGRMFISAGQYRDAMMLFQEALEIDKKDIGARLAMARVAVERFDGDIQEELDALLADAPNQPEIHVIAARLAIERGRLDDAVREAQRAQALATQQKLPPLEALALLAAVDVRRGRDGAAPIREALEYNPRYGEMFVLLGYLDVIRRLYREADVWLQRAGGHRAGAAGRAARAGPEPDAAGSPWKKRVRTWSRHTKAIPTAPPLPTR